MNDNDNKTDTLDIGCMQAIEALYVYLDGDLESPEMQREFEHHMSDCRSCFARADIEGLLTERLRQSAKGKAPADLQARLRRLMQDF